MQVGSIQRCVSEYSSTILFGCPVWKSSQDTHWVVLVHDFPGGGLGDVYV